MDTVRIDNDLWYQQYSFWGLNRIELLRIDTSNNVLIYNDTGTPDTLLIISEDYIDSGRMWQVSRSDNTEALGYLSQDYQSIYIQALDTKYDFCVEANYIWDWALFWSALYAPNVGKVHVVAENVVSFLHRTRLNGKQYDIPPMHSAEDLDTLIFDINSPELKMIGSEGNAIELSFDPQTIGWTSYSVYSTEFFLEHNSPIYEVNLQLITENNQYYFNFDSYALDSTGYWDVFLSRCCLH
ncbi:MAG: hypothetical protein K9N38_12180 [Candidatus Marinimicrobia bacterium]|nr:hypothetical protein [Candidatus Neomarinimicrobiota bacterium]